MIEQLIATANGIVESSFLGEVPVSGLITGDALASAIGLTAGTAQHSNEPWLKFNLDNRTLFVAKKPYRSHISWNHINAQGAVFGTRTVVLNGKTYKVRLLKGAATDPSAYTAGPDDAGSHGSEWNRLMYHICIGIPADIFTSEGGNKGWASYTENELLVGGNSGLGSFNICQETHGLNPGYTVCRGMYVAGVTYFGYTTKTDHAARMGWRPVLELVG